MLGLTLPRAAFAAAIWLAVAASAAEEAGAAAELAAADDTVAFLSSKGTCEAQPASTTTEAVAANSGSRAKGLTR